MPSLPLPAPFSFGFELAHTMEIFGSERQQ
jgi:hypothetical protein